MLPENTSFSLQGHSRPGDLNPTHTAKPKQAMVIRLTTEALEALEAMPPLEIEFGDSPTIYIGDKEYSMVATKESCPHDLYLRTYTASKPGAPLRLHANVTGKFMVRPGLDKAVANIRAGTQQLKDSKGRGIVQIKDPPPKTAAASSNPPPKRKKPTGTTPMFKKPPPQPSYIKVPEQSNLPTPSTSSSSIAPKPAPAPPKPVDPGLKLRLIKCLARSSRSTEEIFRLFSDADRASVSQALNGIAEQKDKTWSLTNRSWLSVRPYDWDKCSEADRNRMAQQARLAAAALKIPESDPVWNHFKPPPPPPAIVSTTTQTAPKRSVPPSKEKDVKDKKPPTPATVKSESSRASPALNAKETTKPAPMRRPGSGYQVRRSTPADVGSPNIPSSSSAPTTHSIDNHHSSAAGTSNAANRRPVPPSESSRPIPNRKEDSYARKQPVATMKEQIASQSTSKAPAPRIPKVKVEEEEEEEGEVDSDEDRNTKRHRAYSPAPPPHRHMEHSSDRDSKRIKSQTISPTVNRQPRNGTRDESRDRGNRPVSPTTERRADDRRSREERERMQKMRDVAKTDRVPKVKKEPESRHDLPTVKRKAVERDDGAESSTVATKKRKTEGQPVVTQRDLSLPKKPEAQKASELPKQRPHKEAPIPVPKIKKEHETHTPRVAAIPLPAASPARSTSSQRGRKRASPNYTSSEEDGETKPLVNGSKSISRPPLPNPNDRKALRARYQRTYSDYIMAFAQVSRQQTLLMGLEGGSGSDVDVDDEVMEPDAIERLRKRYDILKSELETIMGTLGFEP